MTRLDTIMKNTYTIYDTQDRLYPRQKIDETYIVSQNMIFILKTYHNDTISPVLILYFIILILKCLQQQRSTEKMCIC